MIVIKLGGASGINSATVLDELAGLDEPWVLVHGGNEELTQLQQRLDEPARFITSPSGHTSRLTDEATIANIQRAYRGRINNDLVLELQRRGCNAVGLSGIDGGLIRAEQKTAIRAVINGRKMLVKNDLTGRVTSINNHLLRLLLDGGYRPVVTIPALADGIAVNVDGDRVAAQIAAALGAHSLVILSRVPGLLSDIDDDSSLVAIVPADQIDRFEGLAAGRFKQKLIAAREALSAGVGRVILATTETGHPIQEALEGTGTIVQ
jgi:acetylglutamate/LysW-gamma-L-alpha-aminoadipate kinase